MLKRCFIIFVFVSSLVFESLNLAAQNQRPNAEPKLVLRPTVLGVEVKPSDKWATIILIKLSLELENNSDTPIILYKMNDSALKMFNAPFQDIPRLDGKVLVKDLADLDSIFRQLIGAYHGASDVSSNPQWREIRKSIDKPTPPENLTVVILPHKSVKFDREAGMVVTNKRNRPAREGEDKSLEELKQVSQFFLRVWVNLWPSWGIEETTRKELGLRLRERWQQFGFLWLDQIDSIPVQVDLKKAISDIKIN